MDYPIEEQIEVALEDLKDYQKAFDLDEQEIVKAQKKLEGSKRFIRAQEIHLETLQTQYIEKHQDKLEQHFIKNYMGSKDTFESDFDRWLSDVDFEDIQAIVKR